VARNMRDALADPVSVREGKVQLDCTKDLPKLGQMLGPDDDCVVITEEQMAAAKELIQAEINEVEADDDTDIDEDATDVIETPVASYDGNGQDHGDKPLTYTTVGGKKVAIYDGKDFGRSLEGVEALMSWLQARRGGALEVAVIHGGTGQSTAAINAALPEGSHIYALDNFTIHGFSTIPAEQFNQTFSKEIESGRIHADNLQRKQPFPPDRQHLDCVFFEQCVTADKLEQWLPNVQPGGLIAGLGFERTQTARLVKKFAKENDLILQNSDDVWALRVTQKTKIIAEPADNDDERVDLERLAELTNERF